MTGINGINLNKRAKEAIAHGALTNSKRPASLVEGVYPTHLRQGIGSTVIDADGNRYIDLICGLGTNLVGYGNPEISRAVTGAMTTGGSVFSLGSIEEVEYAETIKGVFPFLERVRFLKSGSEGCSAAIKIARAFTGRKLVLSEGYHGWHDAFVQLTPPAYGVPKGTAVEHLEAPYRISAAAIIVEPIITDLSEKRIAWLQNLRHFCTKHEVLLIFDETITAFRFPEYSASRYLNILPDLWIGGKAIAGGLPLSVVGGKKEIMEADYFVSSTWAGDRVALAAAKAANKLVHGDFRPEDLWIYGKEFMDRFNDLSPWVQAVGYPTRGIFKYATDRHKALFMQEMCRAGVLIGPSWFYNKFIHAELDNLISIAKAIIRKIDDGEVRLHGKPPVSPFAEKVRKNAH